MNSINRVSRRFTRLPDAALSCMASSVVVAMTNNPVFTNPLVPLSELSSRQEAFATACAASDMGGKAATAAKNKRRGELLNVLRSQAGYVEYLCRTNLAGLLSSGFTNASNNRTPSALATPAILKILNEGSGRLTLRVKPIANARNYQLQMQVGDGGWQDAGFYSQARRMEVLNLTPGTVYQFRVRALGGSTGTSDWSDAFRQMSL